MKLLRPPQTIDDTEVGGKARGLVNLAAVFRVPAFIILAAEHAGDAEIPIGLEKAVGELLGDASYAVRSSASVEDGDEASFAGIFETHLGVGVSQLRAAIRDVVSSASSWRVTSYIEPRPISAQSIKMSVIIQRMVSADRSGVCLTHQAPGDQIAVVEAVYGLGELLVSGAVEPDTYLVDRASGTVTVSRTGYQAVALQLIEGKPVRRPVSAVDRSAPKLLRSEVAEVARAAVSVERHQRYAAADVEWAFEGSVLYLLQARPYAAISNRADES